MQNKLIIFDIDGTLTDTHHVDSISFEKAILEVLPISSIDTVWHHYQHSTDLGITTEIIQAKLLRNPHQEEIDAIKNKFVTNLTTAFKNYPATCTPVNGAQEIFASISTLGWDIAIATGGWKESALLKLQTASIPHAAIPIANSNDHAEREQIIAIAIERSRAHYKKSYSKIIYIGDKLWDWVAAKNLNIHFIGIGDELGSINNKDFSHIQDYTNAMLERILD